MSRRRFDHFYVELSVAAGARLPRYALWMDFLEHGSDPEDLSAAQVLAWLDDAMDGFLGPHGFAVAGRRRHRLRRAMAHFDPAVATPEERIASFVAR